MKVLLANAEGVRFDRIADEASAEAADEEETVALEAAAALSQPFKKPMPAIAPVKSEEKDSKSLSSIFKLDWYRQSLFLGYSAAVTLFSPAMNLYQIARLNPGALTKLASSSGSSLVFTNFRLVASIIPHQIALRMLQVNLSTPVKDHLDPWLAFATLGVLQGAVYGQANVNFARRLGLSGPVAATVSIGQNITAMRGMFRGSLFACCRDVISQGVPFMLSHKFSEKYLDPVLPGRDSRTMAIKHWTSVMGISIVSTHLSHGFHVCQTAMQTDPKLGYVESVKYVYKTHGVKALWKGVGARVGLLMMTNCFNEIFLKPAWATR
mmetsp:Transcript_4336/g.6502  ORF Transcript_4336/g.6502 Transcript_4336/m.6502 type:complete len:323 (-) Transcript_4336:139-1107(-)